MVPTTVQIQAKLTKEASPSATRPTPPPSGTPRSLPYCDASGQAFRAWPFLTLTPLASQGALGSLRSKLPQLHPPGPWKMRFNRILARE